MEDSTGKQQAIREAVSKPVPKKQPDPIEVINMDAGQTVRETEKASTDNQEAGKSEGKATENNREAGTSEGKATKDQDSFEDSDGDAGQAVGKNS